MYVYFFKIITGRNKQNCMHCYNPYLKQNISVFTFFAYYLTIKMVSGKSPPPKNEHPENSHPSNPPWRTLPPPSQKIPSQKIPTRNSPTYVFKHFVFSLSSPLSLVLLKRLFCISFLKKCWSKTCYSVLKKIYSLPAIREMFWIWWKFFPYFNSGNIQL